MKATDLLEKQHRVVEKLFKRLEGGRADAEAVLHELANNLAAHMAIEQEIFYPAVRAIDPKLVLESYEEHALAELALKRLLATDPSDASFKARVKATKELIAHHVEEEEEDLFPKCDKKLGDEALEMLGKRMKDLFDQVMQHGFEATVPKGFAKTSSDVDKRSLKTNNGQREAHATRG